jgi:hypothetical protein
MKRSVWMVALLAGAACGGGGNNVVVRAVLDGQPVGGLPVTLLSYDRQAVLDSIADDQGVPEPKMPATAVQRLRSLQAEASAVKQKGDTAALGRIEAQRRALLAQVDSVRKARDKWQHDMDEDFQKAVGSLPAHTDTTDATGRASFGADAGKWYAVSRYVLPDVVLEWQVPVTARKGDSTVVRLTRRNAREEPTPP